jgi:hypothetical protein
MAAFQTFKDLQDQVLGWLDEAGSTDTTLTNVKNALNQAQQMRCAQEPWPFLRWSDLPETFTLSTSTRLYTLHPEFWRLEYMRNRTSRAFLVEVPTRQLSEVGENWMEGSGKSPYFRLVGTQPVASQPSAASVITIVSSSASDTTAAKAITVRGISSGSLASDTITPNGTTPVAGTVSFTRVLAVTKAAAWVGTATLSSNSAAVTVLSLGPTEYGKSYRQLELLKTPDAADVIEYRFFRQPLAMVSDNDLPDIPPPHAQILVWDALLLFAGYNTDLGGNAVKIWGGLQASMEEDMRKLWIEGQGVEARPRFVRNMGEEGPLGPRVFG